MASTGRLRADTRHEGMTPRLRKLALTAHVVSSVGWLGAVACVLALAVAGLASQEAQVVRAVYPAMELAAWYVLLPLALASLLTGIVQSVGTKWGLFRHYWVVVKLVINVLATVVLLLYLETLDYLADAAATSSSADLSGLRSASPALHAGAALLLLVVATVLALYKPRGMTRYGWRRQQEQQAVSSR
ncbi:MAG: DUF2269 domain-containing protein [Actinobacteria bacterium]|nr:DUF2269 domain-containing protein [Actinomycetota bacterium]